MLKATLVGVGLWLSSLAAGTASIALGEYGAPLWAIVLLLIWLVTLGAPTTVAVLAIVWYWPAVSTRNSIRIRGSRLGSKRVFAGTGRLPTR